MASPCSARLRGGVILQRSLTCPAIRLVFWLIGACCSYVLRLKCLGASFSARPAHSRHRLGIAASRSWFGAARRTLLLLAAGVALVLPSRHRRGLPPSRSYCGPIASATAEGRPTAPSQSRNLHRPRSPLTPAVLVVPVVACVTRGGCSKFVIHFATSTEPDASCAGEAARPVMPASRQIAPQ